jgi:6-phosphogluconolactonase/glucosamine-6-phosphate isomerase/deaminase
MAIVMPHSEDDVVNNTQKRKKFINKTWVPILLFILYTLTPNTKEAMLIIAGGKTLDYVQQDTSLQKIPYKTSELILKKMDEYINNVDKPDYNDSFKK